MIKRWRFRDDGKLERNCGLFDHAFASANMTVQGAQNGGKVVPVLLMHIATVDGLRIVISQSWKAALRETGVGRGESKWVKEGLIERGGAKEREAIR